MCILAALFPVFLFNLLGKKFDAPNLKLAEDVSIIRFDNLGY
tara:strand:- start:2643 stop:2768 length:126 start_codon:yes stop_codon:yes gene_type:complete